MKTCSKCGYASPDDSSFCMKCGAYFESEPAAPTTGTTSMPGAPVQGAVDAEVSMERGFAKIQAGDFAGAVAAWTQAVKAGLAPSAEVYGRMLDGCVDEIVRSSADTSTHSRAGIADLAILIDDYDLITDLMAGLRDRSQQLGTQRELMNTMNEYMFLAIESFSVYTDLNDLSAICAEAVRVFTRAKLAESVHAERYMEAYNNIDAADDDAYFLCPVCGYIEKGDDFEVCPICGAKKSAFKQF